MARVLVAGIYMAQLPNTAAHIIRELAATPTHEVVQRWIALAPGGRGCCDLPFTEFVVTERTPKFQLLDKLIEDAEAFDWVFLCDDDVELSLDFLDRFISLTERYDFALCAACAYGGQNKSGVFLRDPPQSASQTGPENEETALNQSQGG